MVLLKKIVVVEDSFFHGFPMFSCFFLGKPRLYLQYELWFSVGLPFFSLFFHELVPPRYTILDLFAKAAKPERVFVGVCWQAEQGEKNLIFGMASKRQPVTDLFGLAQTAKNPK